MAFDNRDYVIFSAIAAGAGFSRASPGLCRLALDSYSCIKGYVPDRYEAMGLIFDWARDGDFLSERD